MGRIHSIAVLGNLFGHRSFIARRPTETPLGLIVDLTFRLFVTDAGDSRVLRIANVATAGTAFTRSVLRRGLRLTLLEGSM
ncbi:MAG: hypothetical protein HY774_14930 [Acidobacteria bacterium]|nr:hypothetical protein [Acidobacteriota bacterium]